MQTQTTEPKKTSSRQIIFVLGLFSILSGLSGSSTNLAIPKIGMDLGVSSGASTWIVQIGLITTAILLVLFGHLGDLVSKDFVFIWGGVAFLVGSAVTGIAPNYPIILIGRFVQSVGSAMIMANSMGIVTENIPNSKRAEALSAISMFTSVGTISGPALGGFIISFASWRWIYLINVPLGIIVLFIGFKILPLPKGGFSEIRPKMKGANWTGQNIFTIGMIIFFMSGSLLQTGAKNIAWGGLLLVVGAALTVYSFYQDDRSKSPWIARELLRNSTYMISIVVMLAAMLINAVSNILLPFYLQSFSGLSPFYSGLIMMLQSLTMLFVTPISGYLADHWNRGMLTALGLVILAISQIGYALYPANLNLVLIIIPVVINGIGMGLFLSPNNAMTMSSVDKSLYGVAGSFNSFARTLGMTIGISFASSALFMQLPGTRRVTPQLGASFMHAYANVFWITVGLAVIAIFVELYRLMQMRKTAKS
ncbi:MFS transporter [Lentilactobacillus kosonis]|uniref:Major facilitator superfamily (MFS) profile domain-containing protein n=1 Tax=Lentilactobacillus kosonis TaxID=2810561 RepID=A0A401FI58_9LACO|nr:MFS transporter [Lentilactobacillus kosonis]GAY72055.1 hypothetical protein NBRC111893_201 [Lentilactobacillus kosonis]